MKKCEFQQPNASLPEVNLNQQKVNFKTSPLLGTSKQLKSCVFGLMTSNFFNDKIIFCEEVPLTCGFCNRIRRKYYYWRTSALPQPYNSVTNQKDEYHSYYSQLIFKNNIRQTGRSVQHEKVVRFVDWRLAIHILLIVHKN